MKNLSFLQKRISNKLLNVNTIVLARLSLVFLTNSVIFSSWIIYIPSIKESLILSDSELGIALFFMPFGGLFSLLFCDSIIIKIGAVKTTIVTTTIYIVSIILPVYSKTLIHLCFGLFIFGILASLMNVAMNTLVIEYENKYKRMILNKCHSAYSMGAFIGAIIGAIILRFNVSKETHISFLILCFVLLNFIPVRHSVKIKNRTITQKKISLKNISKPFIIICAVSFIVMLLEGAIADWGGVFLKNQTLAKDYQLALGYSFFSIFMFLGRFFGDSITIRFGLFNVLILCSFIGFTGICLIVFFKSLIISICGFAIMGLGLSILVPNLFRVGEQFFFKNATQSIKFISGFGMIGFLLGPVIIGLVADVTGLFTSFSLLVFFTFLSLILLINLKKHDKIKSK